MGHGPSTTERRVDRFSANGVYYSASTTPGLAESTTVSVHDASASGILNRTEDGSNGAVRETTIGSADTEGFMMGSRRTRPANVPGSAWTSSTIIGADRVTATDINHTGDLTEEVTTCGGPPAAIVGQRTAHVDRVDLRGATAWTDGHAMRAAWDGGEVQGGTLDETDLNGATTRSASLTEAGTGRGRVRVADMEHPDRAGTTMVVDGAHIDGLTYGDAETSADVQGLRADRIFAETTDSGMVAGATGVSGDSLYLDHRPRDPDAAGYSVSAEGIRNGSGHATFNRDPRGELGFATAHLEGVDADRLDYEYRSGTPDVSHDPSFMEQLADAHNITLDALNHAEGEITVRYPISGGVVGSLNIPVRNGTITPNDIIAALETQYFSIPASSRIGYFVPDWRVQTLTLLGEAPIPVASSAEVIQRIYHTISGQPPGTRHSTHGPAAAVSPWMDDLEILTNLRDVGGGAIELPGARFRVDPGARVTTSGTVGRDMTVGTEGLGIRGLETDDGTTRVGEVTTGSTETRMQGLSTLRPTYSGSIRDLHVGNVDYSAVGPLGSATEPRDRGAETAGYYSAEGASDRPQDLARYRDLPPDQVTSPVPDDEAAARRTRTRRW
jgi:hypothetical protein